MSAVQLLGAARIRQLAEAVNLRPTKKWGQNFVVDANTVRRIVQVARVQPGECVLEVGPGLGSLTLGLMEAGADVIAVEIDPALAAQLPLTIAEQGADPSSLTVLNADALEIDALPASPTALVANLPYNIAVPVLLHLLIQIPTLRRALVMVQAEVADRLAAPPGSRTYGVPSVKARWFGEVHRAGSVPPSVFWPVPRVESGLVRIDCGPPPAGDVQRDAVFAVIDAAFAQRRKMLRVALAPWAGSKSRAEAVLNSAG
ncbi:MAG TPA: 16S rRNA (adenine(1518)-N(6)/adenine(1519)-N(6))-dimethyltransferase, partial [Actinobacteria bacterium]|nr:16S rRNA (adenine(1518)-N(6)/adenine(1519)-N(6))-dimethyltransferase [Actinomycetota bacterium]